MNTPRHKAGHSLPPWAGPVAEFAVVLGLSLAALTIVIPAGTAESDNFGLSPRMLPVATVSVIAVMSSVTLVAGLFGQRPAERIETRGLGGVVLLVLATLAGIFAIRTLGIIAGGTALVLLASLAVGERRPLWILGAGIGAFGLLYLVVLSGL